MLLLPVPLVLLVLVLGVVAVAMVVEGGERRYLDGAG